MLVKNNEISMLNFLTQSSGVSYELNLYSINSIIDFDIILCHTEYTTFCEKKTHDERIRCKTYHL